MARRLEVAIVGDASQFLREMKGAESTTAKFGRAAGVVGTALIGGLAVGLTKSAKAAMDAQKVQAQTESQLKTLGISYKAHAGEIQNTIDKTSKLAAVDDEELQVSFNQLVRTSGSVKRALRDTALAADISRAKNISLEAATSLVTKAELGKAGALTRAGIQVDKNATKTELLAKLQDKFAGSSEAFGKTAAGSQERFRIAVENLEESLGKALLPAIEKVAGAMSKLVGFFEEHKTITKILVGLIGTLAGVMVAASAATKIYGAVTKVAAAMQWLLNAAMEANPIGLVILALVALGAALVVAWKKSETFREIVTGVWDAIKDGAQAVLDFFRNNWKIIATLISGPFAPLVLLATDAFGIRSALVKGAKVVIDFFRNNWPIIATLISGPFAPLVALATNAFGVRSALVGAFTAIKTFVTNTVGDIAGIITGLPRRIANFGGALANTIVGFISSANIGGRIADFVARWAGFFGDIPAAVGRAVKGKAQALWEAIKGIFDRLPGFIRKALGIASPSKEFEAIGVAIMEGAIKGIKGLKDELISAAMDAFKEVFGVAKDVVDKLAGLFDDAADPAKVSAVIKMVQKAGEIDAAHYPYVWGGGHNSSFSGPYDCSGAVSAVLHAGGLLGSPLVSGDLANWGASGFGKYVTIFADAVHTFMVLLGRGFGTGTENARGGAGWLSYNTPYRSGFATRHPPGLAAGGYVAKTGFAVVHEGERFSGVGRGMGGDTYVTVNMPNYLGNVRDAAEQIRQELTRNGIRQGGGILRGTA